MRAVYAVELANIDTRQMFAHGTIEAPDARSAVLMLAQMTGVGLDVCGRAMAAGEDWACELGRISIGFCVARLAQ